MGNACGQLAQGRQFFRSNELGLCLPEIGSRLLNLLLHLLAEILELLIPGGILNRQAGLLSKSHDRIERLLGQPSSGFGVICGDGPQGLLLREKGNDHKGVEVEFFF